MGLGWGMTAMRAQSKASTQARAGGPPARAAKRHPGFQRESAARTPKKGTTRGKARHAPAGGGVQSERLRLQGDAGRHGPVARSARQQLQRELRAGEGTDDAHREAQRLRWCRWAGRVNRYVERSAREVKWSKEQCVVSCAAGLLKARRTKREATQQRRAERSQGEGG